MPADSADPMEELHSAWTILIEFALKRPALWRLYAQYAMPPSDLFSEVCASMQLQIQRLVELGRFRESEENAASAVWAANQGVIALILQGESPEDVQVMSEVLFRAVTAQLEREPLPK